MVKILRLKVSSVSENSQADKVGIRPGDYLISYNQSPVRKNEELSGVIRFSKTTGRNEFPLAFWQDKVRKVARVSSDPLGLVCIEEEISIDQALLDARAHRDLSVLPDDVVARLASVVQLSTSPYIPNRAPTENLGIVSAECVYGMNIIKDLFNVVRDVVGGRSETIETLIKDARFQVFNDLQKNAALFGADAVVSISTGVSEIDGGGKAGMLVVHGTGTAVRLGPAAQ